MIKEFALVSSSLIRKTSIYFMYRGLDTFSRNPAFIFTISASNVSQEFYIIGARLRLHVYSCCDRDIGQIPWFSRKYRVRTTKPYPTDRLSVSIIIIGRIIGDTLMLNRANVPRDVPVAQSAGMSRCFVTGSIASRTSH